MELDFFFRSNSSKTRFHSATFLSHLKWPARSLAHNLYLLLLQSLDYVEKEDKIAQRVTQQDKSGSWFIIILLGKKRNIMSAIEIGNP